MGGDLRWLGTYFPLPTYHSMILPVSNHSSPARLSLRVRGLVLLAVGSLFLTGCGGQAITVYEAPKERHRVADSLGEIRDFGAEETD